MHAFVCIYLNMQIWTHTSLTRLRCRRFKMVPSCAETSGTRRCNRDGNRWDDNWEVNDGEHEGSVTSNCAMTGCLHGARIPRLEVRWLRLLVCLAVSPVRFSTGMSVHFCAVISIVEVDSRCFNRCMSQGCCTNINDLELYFGWVLDLYAQRVA